MSVKVKLRSFLRRLQKHTVVINLFVSPWDPNEIRSLHRHLAPGPQTYNYGLDTNVPETRRLGDVFVLNRLFVTKNRSKVNGIFYLHDEQYLPLYECLTADLLVGKTTENTRNGKDDTVFGYAGFFISDGISRQVFTCNCQFRRLRSHAHVQRKSKVFGCNVDLRFV